MKMEQYKKFLQMLGNDRRNNLPKEVKDAAVTLMKYTRKPGPTISRDTMERIAASLLGISIEKTQEEYWRSTTITPKWWKDRMEKHDFSDGFIATVCPRELLSTYIDHVEWLKNKETGEVILQSQPYTVNAWHIPHFEKLIELCKKYKLGFSLSSQSYHYPGETIRLWIYPDDSGGNKK